MGGQPRSRAPPTMIASMALGTAPARISGRKDKEIAPKKFLSWVELGKWGENGRPRGREEEVWGEGYGDTDS